MTSPPRRKPKRNAGLRERQRDFTRRHILQTGLEAFAQRGYSQVTVDGLLQRCGCARGTFYSYFPGGRDDLFRAIYQEIGEEFDARFADALDEVGDDLLPTVRQAAEILIDIAEQPGKGRFFMIEAPALPHVLGDTLGRTTRGLIRALSERIESAQQRGAIDPAVNAAELSHLLVGILRGVALRAAEGEATTEDIMGALDALITGALDERVGRRRSSKASGD